jgi:hypothetical protein
MKSSIKIIAVLFFFFINFIGCERPCGSGNPLPFFDIKGLRGVYNLKDSGHSTVANEEVNIKDYRMDLMLDVTYYAYQQKSGYNSIACSPLESGYNGTTEKIDYIKITADKSYDEKHDVNTSLNDLVRIYNFAYGQKGSNQTLDDYLKSILFSPKSYGLSITFSNPPSKKQSIIFTVEYALTNGEKYTAKSLPIIIY